MAHKKSTGFLTTGDAKGWRSILQGGLIAKPGNSEEYYTGGWRTFRPVVDKKRCINCMLCWMMCPDISVRPENGTMAGYDYDHCKGCGICAELCPVKCIMMVKDEDFEELSKSKDFDEFGRTTTKEIKQK